MDLCTGVTIAKKGKIDTIHIDTPYSTAIVSLFGGHVLSFIPKHDNRERLWLSNNAIFDGKKPIRGGVPVCWPWFSDAHNQDRSDLPSHGYLRTQKWSIINTSYEPSKTTIKLVPESHQGPGWQVNTPVSLIIEIGKTLKIALQTVNMHDEPVALNCALHTYFNIANIETVKLSGLSGKYRDKTKDWASFDTPADYVFNQETDRVHLDQPEQIDITDNHLHTKVLSSGHDSIVVWNPWAQNSRNMNDMEDLGYQKMVCVETALTQEYSLLPGETHQLIQEIG